MGNCEIHQRTKEIFGMMDIALDKTRLCAGSALTGRLTLFLKQQYPGRQLCIRVRGIESIKKGSQEFAENEIFGDTILLVAVGTLKEGEHKFFFEYKLPSDLQVQFNSNVVSIEPKFAASMVFQVKAILDPVELVSDEFVRIEQAVYFSFLTDIPRTSLSSTSSGKLRNEHSEYGDVEIVLKSERSAYDSGEKVRIEVSLNNSEVTIPLEHIRYNFIREIQFLGKAKNAYFEKIRHDFDPLPEKLVLINEQTKLSINPRERVPALQVITFDLPQGLQPSFSGRQFTCKYFFELYAHYVKDELNFIDAKARLKIAVIPEKNRNYVDLNNILSQQQQHVAMPQLESYKLNASKIQTNLISSQLPFKKNATTAATEQSQIKSSAQKMDGHATNNNSFITRSVYPNEQAYNQPLHPVQELYVQEIPTFIPESSALQQQQQQLQSYSSNSAILPSQTPQGSPRNNANNNNITESQILGLSPQLPISATPSPFSANAAGAGTSIFANNHSNQYGQNQKQINDDAPLYI